MMSRQDRSAAAILACLVDKRDRSDAKGRFIGYRNGLALNATLATKEVWTVADIEARTKELASCAIARFPFD
jgi:hypothetical protein